MNSRKAPDIMVIDDSDEETRERRSRAPSPPVSQRGLPPRPSAITPGEGTNQQNNMRGLTGHPGLQVIDLEEQEQRTMTQSEVVPDGIEVIDLEDFEEKFEAEFAAEQALPAPQAMKTTRNLPIAFPWIYVESVQIRDLALRVGKMVELTNGEFLQITKILKNSVTMIIRLRGWRLKRCTEMGGPLLRKLNELCFIHEVLLDDPRPVPQQSVIEVGLDVVVKLRLLIRTNFPFPKESEKPRWNGVSEDCQENKRHVIENERLTVRWKHIIFYDNAQEQAKSQAYQGNVRKWVFLRLEEHECTSAQYYLPRDAQRRDWRGDTKLGGSYNPPDSAVRKSVDSRRHKSDFSGQRFTLGDAFGGAGGATRGALDAGFRISWGFDCDCNPGMSWRANFRSARHYEMWAHEFVALPGPLRRFLVDVLHLSPPCQVYSPVHTREGKNDEQNFYSLLACGEIIKKCKPRIVTLEQTFGILHTKFQKAFHSLIQMFTSLGYSVSWQTVYFPNYGLAQSRRRLILLAAAPGEALPELPAYTHSDNAFDNLKPYNSVRNFLSKIPRNAANHDIQAALNRRKNKLVAWDDSGITTCITCDGGNRGHPSGTRDFTEREIAILQSFPLHHVFCGNAIRKQIGNSYPPLIAKIIFQQVLRHLEKEDGLID